MTILSNCSWKKIENLDTDIALLPAGSTEQHGHHLPLNTDSIIAEKIAQKTAEKTDIICLPTLKYGVSEEHREFNGTLWISTDTYRKIISDIFQSLEKNDMEKVIVVNGHGGNIDPLQEVCRKTTRHTSLFATEWIWWRALNLQKQLGHAGKLETSLLLYLQKEHIDQEKAKKGPNSWGKIIEGSQTLYDVEQFTDTGTIGNPKEATKQKGKKLFKKSTKSLINLIQTLKKQ